MPESRVITIPPNGGVLVTTQDELTALKVMLAQLDSITGAILTPRQWQAIRHLALEVCEI